jgi:hypothetical protein
MMGSKEVTGNGTASVTHHTAIHTVTAITFTAPGGHASRVSKAKDHEKKQWTGEEPNPFKSV